MQGHILKRSNVDYVVGCDENGNGGYDVVPKELDPYNSYTIEEVEAYLIEHPEMLLDYEAISTEQLISQAKAQRDLCISQVEWRRSRHQDEVSLGLEPTEPLLPILAYIQSLRDITQQEGFPEDIEWPVPPWEEEVIND